MSKLLTLILLGGLLFMMILSILEMPSIGDEKNPSYNEVTEYYLENSVADTKTPNVVTAVLKYYRAVDTLLEAAVLFTAIAAVLTVLKEGKKENENG